MLACLLFSYGMAKVFHVQFPYPDMTTLIRPFGELETPMRLLWSFMGFSRPYQVFAGVLECSAALLLFWNRTTTLGALLGCGTLVNVLVMDWSYAVPVKMIVVQMLFYSGFLLVCDARRLARVLIWNLPTKSAGDLIPWRAWRWKWAVYALKIGIVSLILGSQVQRAAAVHPRVVDPGQPPLYGVYRVERHSMGGLDLPVDDAARWSLLAFGNRTRNTSLMTIRRIDESWRSDFVEYGEEGARMVIGRDAGTLQISKLSAETVHLEGFLDAESLSVTLRRLPNPEFPLEKDAQPRWIFFW